MYNMNVINPLAEKKKQLCINMWLKNLECLQFQKKKKGEIQLIQGENMEINVI